MRVPAARTHARPGALWVAAVAIGLSTLAIPANASGSVTATAHAKHARHTSPQCPAAYPLQKVHAGLHGTGWTTVKGVRPRPFSVRVLGKLHDGIAPGIDMIVIKTHSKTIKHHGTWEGMSGSPIYADDGRLIGALSYGLSFGATNKAGVTPAAAMYELLNDRNGASSKPYAKHVAIPRSMGATSADNSGDSSSSSELQLLPTPITVTGLPSSRYAELRSRLRTAGTAPFSLHSGSAKGVQRHGSAKNIRPGAPFAVTIAYGDYTIGGVGTVTAVCNHKVLAFGHPMNLTGATTETANTARVLYIQRDPTGPSFVMANIGHSVGTLDQDRLSGIRATLGARPPATRIVTHVTAPITRMHRTGVTHTSLVDEVADATGGSTFYNLLTTMQHEGAGSSSYSWTAKGRLDDGTPWSFHRTDLYTDPFDVEFGTSWQIYQTLATIVGNPFDGLSVSDVKVHATATETVKEWELRDLDVQQSGIWQDVTPSTTIDVSPGDTVQLRAKLAAYRNSHQTKTVHIAVHIPADAGAGSGKIQVAGGGDLGQFGPDTSTVTSFSDLLKVLKAVPHGDDLNTQLVVPDPTGLTTIMKNHNDALKRVVRGTLTLQLNVLGPACTDPDCGGGDEPPVVD